jgi:hypothetical protein
MENNGMPPTIKKEIIIAVVAIIFGSALTILGQPIFNRYFENTQTPILETDIHVPDINSYPSEIKSQISIVPIVYNLTHYSGGTAKGITILLDSVDPIEKSQLIFDSLSEPYTIDFISTTVKIDIQTVRPEGFIAFQVFVDPGNKIKWSHLIEEGKIIEEGSSPSDTNTMTLIMILVAVVIVILVVVIFARYWVKTIVDAADATNVTIGRAELISFIESNEVFLIQIIIGIFAYNFLASAIPTLLFIRLPTVSFEQIFYALFMIFFVINFRTFIDFFRGLSKVFDEKQPDE